MVDMLQDIGGELCVTIVTKLGIILNWMSGAVHHCVIHYWKAATVSILMRCGVLVYLVYSDNYGYFNCKYSNNIFKHYVLIIYTDVYFYFMFMYKYVYLHVLKHCIHIYANQVT